MWNLIKNNTNDGGGLVAESCPTLATPWTVARQAPLSSIFQARILEWVAVFFSRGSSQPRNWIQVSSIVGDSLPAEPPGKHKDAGVGGLSLLQLIIPTQELNRGLLHCWQILYQLSYRGSPLKELMLLNCGVGEDSWESLGLQENPTSPS